MAIIKTRVNPHDAAFQANAEHHRALSADLQKLLDSIREGGGAAAVARHKGRGKLTARERINTLLDPGSPFLELAPLAAHEVYGEDVPAAGIIAFAVGAGTAAFIGWFAKRRIGGLTGDVLGAAQQMSEAAIMLVVVALA